MSLWGDFKTLLSGKARQLQNRTGQPNTRVDEPITRDRSSFSGQNELDRGDLREIRDMRESGGVVSHLVHAKALMQFGTGAEWEAEDDDLKEWLEDAFGNLDNLLIRLGEDAIWYPASFGDIVETRGGDFSHVEPVEPWTMLPEENAYGEVVAWEQVVKQNGSRVSEVFEPDDIASFILNRSSARDKTGVSEVWRAKQEIQSYRKNADAITNAVQLHAYPQRHVKVGREDAAVIDDNELRRVRNKFSGWDEDTVWVTGRDVEIEPIEAENFDFETVTEHDLRKLALALGLPLELANVGSDGLGSGMPADLRLTLFERQARAAQRSLADQFVEQVVAPVLEEYSPFNPENVDVALRFGDPIADREDSSLTDLAPYMTLNEIREELDKPPEEDDELGESYRKPANVEAPEQEEPEDDGGGIGGLFEDAPEGESETTLADGGTGNKEAWPEWDAKLFELQRQAWEADSNRELVQFNFNEVPEFVKERLREAVLAGNLFSDIQSIPSSERQQLREIFLENLQSDSWTIDGVADHIEQLGVDSDTAETITRTEIHEFVADARESGYEERDEGDELFYWTGNLGPRTTDTCKYLIAGTSADLENPGAFSGLDRPNGTNPNHGGTPMKMDELKEHIQEVAEADPEVTTEPREWTPHINCRKTFVRHVE